MNDNTHQHWPGSADAQDGRHSPAERRADVVSYLQGTLDDTTMLAMRDVWGRLETLSVTDDAHARAVRERVFWESLLDSDLARHADVDHETVVQLDDHRRDGGHHDVAAA